MGLEMRKECEKCVHHWPWMTQLLSVYMNAHFARNALRI
jgi:hypothetical protein